MNKVAGGSSFNVSAGKKRKLFNYETEWKRAALMNLIYFLGFCIFIGLGMLESVLHGF